jgi:hypothetical protein
MKLNWRLSFLKLAKTFKLVYKHCQLFLDNLVYREYISTKVHQTQFDNQMVQSS